MHDARNTKNKYQASLPPKKRPKWRLKTTGKDDVDNDIRKMGILDWREVVEDRNGWRRGTRETLTLLCMVEPQ